MEHFANIQLNWSDFLAVAIALAGLYTALQFISRLLQGTAFLGRFQSVAENIVYNILLVFEPLAALILIGTFILVNPVLHGVMIGILLLLGSRHLINYVSGRIVLFDDSIALGNRLAVPGTSGIIAEKGRLGLKLRTNKGLHFINHTKLLSDGYTLLSGEQVGGFYELKLSLLDNGQKAIDTEELMDKLTTNPYLDWNHKPQLRLSAEVPNLLHTRLMVREENHLHELLSLLEEWGYDCKISKK